MRTIVSILVLVAICGGAVGTAQADHSIAEANATKAADAWLKLVDDGKYRETWEQAPTVFRNIPKKSPPFQAFSKINFILKTIGYIFLLLIISILLMMRQADSYELSKLAVIFSFLSI